MNWIGVVGGIRKLDVNANGGLSAEWCLLPSYSKRSIVTARSGVRVYRFSVEMNADDGKGYGCATGETADSPHPGSSLVASDDALRTGGPSGLGISRLL